MSERRGSSHGFETAIGPCALCWTDLGVAALFLPGPGSEAPSAEALAEWKPTRPPRHIRAIIARIREHLAGTPQAFDDVPVDLGALPPFTRGVYDEARRLASGQICTYGDLARAVGRPGGARAVGQALGRNPLPIIIPCHRIVAAGGKPGGFSAPGGLDTKRALLAAEGVDLAQPGALPSLWDAGTLPKAVKHLRRDAAMRRVIDKVGPCRLERHWNSVFEALCVSIIHQQLAGKAAAAITRRFHALVPVVEPHAVLAVSDEAYRGAGLSSGKISSLRAVAQAAVEGQVRLDEVPRMTDAEISTHLTPLRGIGPWTVQMLLIFHLGRPDVLPVGDLGIRKAMQRIAALKQLPTPDEMERAAERWKPWRTVAMWYLWRTLD